MDDPALDDAAHHAALVGLRRINRFSLGGHVLWKAIEQRARQSPRPIRVLDIATGGGDGITALARRAATLGRKIEWHACDISERALEFAAQHATDRGVDNIRFFCLNALEDQIPGDFDVIMCSLFLHHLPEQDAETLLRRMGAATVGCVLVNDLRRTRLGYMLAQVGCRLLTRSYVVHTDGPLSVRAAFSDAEVTSLAERAGLSGSQLIHFWPQRFLLSWSRS